MSTCGRWRQKVATWGNQGQGTIVDADETRPKSTRSAKADRLAWHMPMSSVWMMATRSPSPKPSLRRTGLGTIALSLGRLRPELWQVAAMRLQQIVQHRLDLIGGGAQRVGEQRLIGSLA